MKNKLEGAGTCGVAHCGTEVALEPDALHVLAPTAGNQLHQNVFVPCSALQDWCVDELLMARRPVSQRRALFNHTSNVANELEQDSPLLNDEAVVRRVEKMRLPSRTPARPPKPA